jgi:hypothetical protein
MQSGGKSKIELAHHSAAETAFPGAKSGAILRDAAFKTRKSWSVDISATIEDKRVVMEYDGAYWHREPSKILIDEYKTRDLLGAGYVVVRLREDDLPPLGVHHRNYHEVQVYSAAPKPHEVMNTIKGLMG